MDNFKTIDNFKTMVNFKTEDNFKAMHDFTTVDNFKTVGNFKTWPALNPRSTLKPCITLNQRETLKPWTTLKSWTTLKPLTTLKPRTSLKSWPTLKPWFFVLLLKRTRQTMVTFKPPGNFNTVDNFKTIDNFKTMGNIKTMVNFKTMDNFKTIDIPFFVTRLNRVSLLRIFLLLTDLSDVSSSIISVNNNVHCPVSRQFSKLLRSTNRFSGIDYQVYTLTHQATVACPVGHEEERASHPTDRGSDTTRMNSSSNNHRQVEIYFKTTVL
uniref:Uncharacterized protein n=1 Tax=Trichuris muris TaxID=70415 RepID=A0A5S6QGQ0_TRIMR